MWNNGTKCRPPSISDCTVIQIIFIIQIQIQIQQLFLLRPYSLTDGALQNSANTSLMMIK